MDPQSKEVDVVPHKFAAGRIVRVVPGLHPDDVRGAFKIVRTLPAERGSTSRIKSETDGHERVVTGSEVH
jgi:hypothetical protein